MPTLSTPQRSQTGTASPNHYAQNPSAQPDEESITRCLRPRPSNTKSSAPRSPPTQAAQHRLSDPGPPPTQATPDPRPSNTGPPSAHPKTENPYSPSSACAKAHIATATGHRPNPTHLLREGLNVSDPHKARGIHSPPVRRPTTCAGRRAGRGFTVFSIHSPACAKACLTSSAVGRGRPGMQMLI